MRMSMDAAQPETELSQLMEPAVVPELREGSKIEAPGPPRKQTNGRSGAGLARKKNELKKQLGMKRELTFARRF